MIEAVIIENLKKIILKNNIRFNLYEELKSWNFNANKQKDGYNIKFENGEYYLYKIDMGMGRADDFRKVENEYELIYLVIYRITLTIVEYKLLKYQSDFKIFEFQEELLKSVNDKWWRSAKVYHEEIKKFSNSEETFHKILPKNIKNMLIG